MHSEPRFGGQDIRLAFSEPVDVHFPKRLLQFRVKVSKRNEIGAVIPLTFLSARAVTSDGEEIQLRTEDGMIQVVESLDEPFDPEAIPTPSETPAGFSTAGINSGGLAVATPDAEFPSPTPRVTPTPIPPILMYVFPTQAYPGTRARIPIVVSDADRLQGGQFLASFNTDVIQLRKVKSGDAFSGFFAFGNPTPNGGMVAVAGTHPTSYLGEATLCLLEVDVSPNALPGTAIRVDLSGVILASAAGEVPTQTQPGFLQIVSPDSEKSSEKRAKPPQGIKRSDLQDKEKTVHPNEPKDRSIDPKGEEPLSVYDVNFDRRVDAYDLLLLIQFLKEESKKTLFD